ncbi:MAG: hypothetical protein U9Q03_05825 [Patescibacteria group bacterium]|nr:hypothetical protein [Patescibacteria group bacterium]
MTFRRIRRANFRKAVDRSFLSAEDKQALMKMAQKDGVNRALWNRFNDYLIAEIVEREAKQRDVTKNLDSEIDKFTKEYEKEKTVIDLKLRADLQELGDTDLETREKLWGAYYEKIGRIQDRLLEKVDKTSKSLLWEVVAVMAYED